MREPILKFQVKKNPHYSRGEMKLYLTSQVAIHRLKLKQCSYQTGALWHWQAFFKNAAVEIA